MEPRGYVVHPLPAETVFYYEADALCQAWCAEALRHGSVKGICLKLGISERFFSGVRRGRERLPRRILEVLGLFPVRAVHSVQILGYISVTPVDFARQWVDPTSSTPAQM